MDKHALSLCGIKRQSIFGHPVVSQVNLRQDCKEALRTVGSLPVRKMVVSSAKRTVESVGRA